MTTPRLALRRAFFAGLERLGRDRALARRMNERGEIAVLNFHRVSPDEHPLAPPMRPELFEDLVAYLAKNCRIALPADELEPAGERATVVLSFDDGCHDFVEYAMPVLARHGVRANQNVVGECVSSGRPLWNQLLYDFLRAAPASLLAELHVPGFAAPLSSRKDEERVALALALSRHLKMRPRREREAMWAPIAAAMARHGDFPGTRMMRAEDVREAGLVHEIGCHSWSHESMEFEDDAFFGADFDRCERLFRDELRLPLRVYAFPNGSSRAGQADALLRRGVARVLVVGERYARPGDRVWSRFTMYGSTEPELHLRAVGWRSEGST